MCGGLSFTSALLPGMKSPFFGSEKGSSNTPSLLDFAVHTICPMNECVVELCKGSSAHDAFMFSGDGHSEVLENLSVQPDRYQNDAVVGLLHVYWI